MNQGSGDNGKTPPRPRIEVDNPRPLGGYFRRLFRAMVFMTVGLGCVGVFAGAVAYIYFSAQLPDFASIHDYQPMLQTRIYDDRGRLIGEFGEERRDIVPFERIPKRLVQAFIASEDSSFFKHSGINYAAILRAAWANLKAGHVVQGGSTMTQQLAKSFFTRDKSLPRKIKEAILARRMEAKLTKEEILFLYMSQIYLGHKSYSVATAVRNYFDKDVSELTLGEMTLIAGLPQAPSSYSPAQDMPAAKERQKYVLRRMVEEGFIDQAAADRAFAEEVTIHSIPDVYNEVTPFFAEHLRRYVEARYGSQALLEGGLRVYGTVDLPLQKAAEDAVYRGIRKMDRKQGYRGPLAHLQTEAERKTLLKKLAARYSDKVQPGKIYVGLVTKVDDEEQAVTVRVGAFEGPIPLRGMLWADKPNPERSSEYPKIDKVSQALKVGDVIQVSATDFKGLYGYETKNEEKAKLTLFRLAQEPLVQGALFSVEPDSGYVKALIGGYDFAESKFNRAQQACRQPGSAMKPLIYTAALAHPEKEYNLSTVVIDSPIIADDFARAERWKPQNYSSEFLGEMTFREALVQSHNIPSVKILLDIGMPYAIEFAHKLGIKSELKEEPGLVLGSSCVTMEELVSAYGVFVRGGTRMPRTYVRRIFDRHGRLIEDHTVYWDELLPPEDKIARLEDSLDEVPERVISEQNAYLITKLLREVVQMGTGVEASRLGLPAGGKTGTTNDQYDAWFIGFTRDLLTAAWIGHDKYERPLGKWESGGKAALPIWLDYMTEAHKGREAREFEVPAGIVFRRIDRVTGLLARPDTRHAMSEAFIEGTAPKEQTNLRGEVEGDMFFKHDVNF